MRDKIAAGVPASKLGIGIDFYGYRWWGGDGTSTGGVSRPRQAWKTYPSVKDNIPYFSLMETYSRYPVSWDPDAQAAYIGIDNPGSAQDEFISFDESGSIYAKARYIEKMGLGGVIVFELGEATGRTCRQGIATSSSRPSATHSRGGKNPPKTRIPPPSLSFLRRTEPPFRGRRVSWRTQRIIPPWRASNSGSTESFRVRRL